MTYRVGAMTQANRGWGFAQRAWRMGREKAAVFPDPVWASPMMSLPWSAYGMASFWMSDGLVNFIVSQASHRGAMMPRSANETAGELSSSAATSWPSSSDPASDADPESSTSSGEGEPEWEDEVEASSGAGIVAGDLGWGESCGQAGREGGNSRAHVLVEIPPAPDRYSRSSTGQHRPCKIFQAARTRHSLQIKTCL